MDYYQLAFPKRITFRATLSDYKRARDLIKKHNGMTAVYRTIYNFEGEPTSRNAIIDKIFFDFDHSETAPNEALFGLRRLHEYLDQENIKHTMFFSGRGFHLFLFTEKRHSREFENPTAVTRNAHNHICQEAGVKPDPKTKDVLRVARLPNTVNIKTGLCCIPLNRDEIYLSRDEILELAKRQRLGPISNMKKEGAEVLKLDDFDFKAFDATSYEVAGSVEDVLIFDGLPKCVAYSLQQGDCGFHERYAIITALRELCYSREDAQDILRSYLSIEKYRHCIHEEHQLDYLYDRTDLLFPSCDTLKAQGLCIKGCKGCDIYG
jgi:hypothetical protein